MIFKGLTDLLIAIMNFLVSALPNSPFQNIVNNSTVSSYINGLNWVLPITQIIATLELWLTAITVVYVYQVLLRWVKAIE